ncbi:hypothetical protein OG912_28715 [Streptomyces sp. NBC_00464]|uniref:hypothetical protein n=1 Tax=Streptomyces sp. NBC_00464 TaxID=2975751 RepID=UPI002E18D5A8
MAFTVFERLGLSGRRDKSARMRKLPYGHVAAPLLGLAYLLHLHLKSHDRPIELYFNGHPSKDAPAAESLC